MNIDDGDIFIGEFANGALGSVQTSFVTVGNYPGIEARLYGEKGAIICRLIEDGALNVADGAIRRLTSRNGREDTPVLSPDGRRMAYVGFDDRRQGYQVTELYVANADGSNPRSITASLDRDAANPQWAGNGTLYFTYVDRGETKLARVSASGGATTSSIGMPSGARKARDGGSRRKCSTSWR